VRAPTRDRGARRWRDGASWSIRHCRRASPSWRFVQHFPSSSRVRIRWPPQPQAGGATMHIQMHTQIEDAQTEGAPTVPTVWCRRLMPGRYCRSRRYLEIVVSSRHPCVPLSWSWCSGGGGRWREGALGVRSGGGAVLAWPAPRPARPASGRTSRSTAVGPRAAPSKPALPRTRRGLARTRSQAP
jgi:hypothetical protein